MIGENARRLGLGEDGGELAQRLAHEPRLHAHRGHAHLAFELGLRHQRGDRINHDDIERIRAGERFTNGQRFFAAVRLRHEQIVEVHAEFFRVARIERVLGVNERRQAAGFLRAGDDVQHQRGLARRFRPEDFHDAAARNAADAERQVQRERAGRNHVNFDQRPGIAEAHDAAFAITLGDGGNGGVEFALVRRGGLGFSGGFFGNFRRHKFFPDFRC